MRSGNLTIRSLNESGANGKICNLDDPLKGQIERRTYIGFILMTSCAFVVFPGKVALGVAAGGGISLLSFRDLSRTLEKLFISMLAGEKNRGAYVTSRHYVKLALMLVILAATMKSDRIDILGLTAGLFLVPAVLIYTGVLLYIGNRGGNR